MFEVVSFGTDFKVSSKDRCGYENNDANVKNVKAEIDTYTSNFGGTNIYKPMDYLIYHYLINFEYQVPEPYTEQIDYYEDPDKRDYIVSNQKIEATGWKPQYSIDDGIQQLIDTYKMIVPRMSSEFRNGFPLGYANTL